LDILNAPIQKFNKSDLTEILRDKIDLPYKILYKDKNIFNNLYNLLFGKF
jgi:hypothetical protein